MSIRQVDFIEKKEFEQEIQVQEADHYDERGCCKTCGESKYEMRGYQENVWLGGKHFQCLCLEGKCTKCSWYYDAKCQREEVIL